MNKKGVSISLYLIGMLVIVLVLAISAIVFSKVFLDVTGELKDVDKFSNNTVNTIEFVESHTIPLLDNLVLWVFVGSFLGLILLAYFADLPPILIIIFILVIILAVILSGLFANIYAEVTENSALSATSTQFNFSNLILGSWFPMIVLVAGIIMVVVLFNRRGGVSPV